eukprot:scaffold80480_cov37-Tisochrysis_lutea.AAC.4
MATALKDALTRYRGHPQRSHSLRLTETHLARHSALGEELDPSESDGNGNGGAASSACSERGGYASAPQQPLPCIFQ